MNIGHLTVQQTADEHNAGIAHLSCRTEDLFPFLMSPPAAADRREAVERMPDSAEKEAARKSLREVEFSPTRIFVGKDKEREARVTLYDAKGSARINMVVDVAGVPRLDFLDEKGKVTYSLPGAAKVTDKKTGTQ